MRKDIPEIINTALGLDPVTAKKYLMEKQIISNHTPVVFVKLLRLEINNLKIKYAPIISVFQKVLRLENPPSIHVKDKRYNVEGRGYNVELAQLESLEKILEEILKDAPEISDIIIGSKISDDLKQLLQKRIFENKFNSTPIELVINHFKQLTETENKDGEYWMTEEDFEIFIRRSFGLENNLPKPKINVGVTGKGIIIKLFYLFYSGSFQYGYSQNKRKGPIATLLKNAFDNNTFDDMTEKRLEDRISDWPWKKLNDKIKL